MRILTDIGDVSAASVKIHVLGGFYGDEQTEALTKLFAGQAAEVKDATMKKMGMTSHRLSFENLDKVSRFMQKVKWNKVKLRYPLVYLKSYLDEKPETVPFKWTFGSASTEIGQGQV